ncbi:CGI-121-domain-containing protein [Marasmius fiardii PR-910]|nr:CGI-121-domain-containing protein [Marasmius fiardii PR-910]
MESLTFDHVRGVGSDTAYVALYSSVTNAATIRKRILDASRMEGKDGERERDAMNFAFIDATLITSRLHLQTAIHQAILAESQNSLRTKTVHSEILFMLNPTNNITEAIRRYGVSDSSRALLVVHISERARSTTSEIEIKMKNAVEGVLSPLDKLEELTDWERIKKYYKLNITEEQTCGDHAFVDDFVTSSVAMKTVMQ